MKELNELELREVEGGQIKDLIDLLLGFLGESTSSVILKAGAVNGYFRDEAGIPASWSGHGY